MPTNFILAEEEGLDNYPFSKVCHDLFTDLCSSKFLKSTYLDIKKANGCPTEHQLKNLIETPDFTGHKYVFVRCSNLKQIHTTKTLIHNQRKNNNDIIISAQTLLVSDANEFNTMSKNEYDHVVYIKNEAKQSDLFHMAEKILLAIRIKTETFTD